MWPLQTEEQENAEVEERDGGTRRRRRAAQLATDFGFTEFADDAQRADKWQLISGLE